MSTATAQILHSVPKGTRQFLPSTDELFYRTLSGQETFGEPFTPAEILRRFEQDLG